MKKVPKWAKIRTKYSISDKAKNTLSFLSTQNGVWAKNIWVLKLELKFLKKRVYKNLMAKPGKSIRPTGILMERQVDLTVVILWHESLVAWQGARQS